MHELLSAGANFCIKSKEVLERGTNMVAICKNVACHWQRHAAVPKFHQESLTLGGCSTGRQTSSAN